jgi:Copper type II ascorbate-dependent monooxygenase, C-terminal domain
VLPKQRHTLTIESHALRLGSGQAARGTVEVCLTEQPEVTAAWLGLQAPVPAIRPHQRESAAAECEFGARWQLFSAWPHMHRSGKRFEVDHLRAGQRESLLVVEPWDFQRQATYLLTQGLEPGDRIALKCVWENQGDEYVLPGPNTEDEMCSLGLIGFPASAAHCEYRE